MVPVKSGGSDGDYERVGSVRGSIACCHLLVEYPYYWLAHGTIERPSLLPPRSSLDAYLVLNIHSLQGAEAIWTRDIHKKLYIRAFFAITLGPDSVPAV